MGSIKSFVLPTCLLAGTIIGAGIFSLPYVFIRAGIGLSYIFLAIFGIVYVFLHLMYGDLMIKNGGDHRFAGLAKIYFGNIGYRLAVLMTIIEMFFVLTIYLVLSSSFISLFAPGLPVIYQVIIFWWLGSIIIFSGTKRVAFFETLAVAGILVAIAVVAWAGAPAFFSKTINFASAAPPLWLLPFGALLFSINGRPAIPSIIHYFKRNGLPAEDAKKTIIWGTLVPVIAYALFIAGVIGLSLSVTPDSITGVVHGLSTPALVIFLAVLGVISLISSYFSIGLDVFNSLKLDVNFSKKFSMFLIIIMPLLIYFIGIGTFTNLVEIAGGIFVGLEGIMILAMWRKMKKGMVEIGSVKKTLIDLKPAGLSWALYGIFGISIGYVILKQIFSF